MDFSNICTKDLLKLQASVIEELKVRKVVCTKNNPIGDYTEWLVANTLGLELQNNSKLGYDGIDSSGLKVQIKGRKITPENKSRQLSAIRKYNDRDFDELAAIIYDENFNIIDAVLIPHEIVGEYASYREHVNAHILIFNGPILKDPRIKNIKSLVSQAFAISDVPPCQSKTTEVA